MALALIAMLPLSFILLRASSWATSRSYLRTSEQLAVVKRPPAIVNTTSDEATPGDGLCSLREAIIAANAGPGVVNDCGGIAGFDTIKFSVSGTIRITGSAFPAIMNPLTIDGTGQRIVVDGAGSFQVFVVDTGVAVTLNDLAITNGNGGMSDGGGIENHGTLAVTNCTIGGNTTMVAGGGIFSDGTLTVTSSTIFGNSAPLGGGILGFDMTVTNSTISGNTATNVGGGIRSVGTWTVTNSTIAGNVATNFGGGLETMWAAR